MIPRTDQHLWQEIQSGIAKREEHTRRFDELIARYHAPAYHADADIYTDYENTTYEWVVLKTAQNVASNPRATVKGWSDPASAAEAEKLENGANRDIRRSVLRRLMQQGFPYWAVGYFVTATTSQPLPSEGKRANCIHGPVTDIIDPEDFFADVYAKSWGKVRICGRRIVTDRDDLLKRAKDHPEEKWDIEAIRSVKASSNLHNLNRGNNESPRVNVDRDEIDYWELYIDEPFTDEGEYPKPGNEADEGIENPEMQQEEAVAEENADSLFNGTLCTVACAAGKPSGDGGGASTVQGIRLRDDRAYFGPPSDEQIKGPFVLHGFEDVPRKLYPLAPCQATYHQARDLNEHVDLMRIHAKKARHFSAIDGLSTDDHEKLKNATDAEVVIVAGLRKDATVDFDFAGITEQDQLIYALKRMSLNRALGLPEQDRGNTETGATATASALASDASSARDEFMAQRYCDGWRAVIKQRVWYLRNDYRIAFRGEDGNWFFGGQDPQKAIDYAAERGLLKGEELQMYLAAIESGQVQPGKTPWHELDIDIDLYSMQRSSEALQGRRLVDGMNTLIAMVPLMVQTPEIAWEDLLDTFGDTMNWPQFSRVLKQAVLARRQAALEQQQQMQAEAEAAGAAGGGQQAQGALKTPAAPQASAQPQSSALPGNTAGSTVAGKVRSGQPVGASKPR